MDYPIGVEMTKDYLSFEVAKGAMTLIKDVMLVKKNENVVITADSSSDRRVAEAVANAAYAIDANPVIIYYPTSSSAYAEPVKPIGNAIKSADVWIELAYSSIMLCESYQKSLENGCRYINLTGMDVLMLTNCIAKVDYMTMVELGETIKAILEKSDEVIIKDDKGTNLIGYNRGRHIRHSGQIAKQNGYAYMMGGQISWCPIEETINGTLVFDTAIFPPTELGIISEPIILTLEEGIVTKVEGGKDAQVLKNWLASFNDPNMYRLAHYSLGFNPGVTKATGRIVEDERIFGCMEFGIGSQGSQIKGKYWTAASHTDGVMSKPTIILDGVPLEENGKYVHPTVVEVCKRLGVQGY